MIIVYYMYYTGDGKLHDGGKSSFYDVKKAARFIRKIRKSNTMIFTSYICEYQDDYEYLMSHGL